jgi:6-phosphogluconolactonase (cycloisomerase 2 family)
MDPVSGGSAVGYAYVTTADVNQSMPGSVYQYGISADGSLAPMAVASVPAGAGPTAVAADPDGRYVYVVNRGDATVSQYAIGTEGGLSPLSPATVGIEGAVAGLTVFVGATVDPSGRFLYVVGRGQDPAATASIAQFSIASTGALAPLNPAVFIAPAFADGPLVIEPTGSYAYVVANLPGAQVMQLSIGSNGTLKALSPASVAATAHATGISIAPSGQAAYVLSACTDSTCEGQIALYTIDASGQLSATGATTVTGPHVIPLRLVSSDSGSSAYLLANLMGVDTNEGAVYQYGVDQTGALTPYSPPSLGVASGAVDESARGANLYALSANAVGQASGAPTGGHIDHYTIGSDGVLTFVSTITVAAGRPTAMAVVKAR